MTRPLILVCALASALFAAPVDPKAPPKSAQTFTGDVAPIFFKHCVQCHRPNSVAPMSLLDYKSARPWAASIKEAALSRNMPPWLADPRYGRFSNDARLSNQELETVKDWVDGGAREGDPRDLPPAPAFSEGWNLGKPDIVVDIGKDFVVKRGIDTYQHFVVPIALPANLKEGIWIRAAELRPGNRKVVHHGHVNVVAGEREPGSTTIQSMNILSPYLLTDGDLTRVRDDAPVLDNSCEADAPDLPYIHGFQEGALASYLPGRSPDVFPEGTAKWIAPGSKLEFVIHYARSKDDSQTDRTSVGLYLAAGAPERILRRMDLRNFFFRIPPGAANHEVKRCYTFEKDKLLLSITPHMHYRGKDARYDLVRPDGRRETLLSVPHYKFDWQLVYRFERPILVEKGSTLTVTVHYDNSVNNGANPDPRKAIRWGDKSEEEMMTSWIEYLDPK